MQKIFTLTLCLTFLLLTSSQVDAQGVVDRQAVKEETTPLLFASLDPALLDDDETTAKEDEKEQLTVATAFDRFDLAAFPNPFAQQVSLEYNSPAKGASITIVVMNSIGQVVYDVSFVSEGAGKSLTTLNMEGIASGVYFVTISDGDAKDTKKLVKQD